MLPSTSTRFLNNKYYRWYVRLVFEEDCTDDYVERHHRIPRSFGGRNIKENMVKLSARRHFLAHWFLTKCTVGEDRTMMQRAFGAWLAMLMGIGAISLGSMSSAGGRTVLRTRASQIPH
jgi:hypothetical protein